MMTKSTPYWMVISLLILTVMLAACGGNKPQATAVPTPAGSPTPIPPGVAGNPIRIVVVSDADLTADDVAAAASTVAQGIQSQTNIAVEMVPVARAADALAALCASDNLTVALAWLDGVSYAAAKAMNCGVPTLQVIYSGDYPAGLAGQIIVSRQLGTTDISLVRNRTFCRLGYDDFYGWLLPYVTFKAAGIDLFTAPEAMIEYDDVPALIQAVAAGDCAAAGVPEDAFTRYADDIDEAASDDAVVAMTTVPFPYPMLVYPFQVDLGVRLAIDDALLEIAAVPESADALRVFLGQDELAAVDSEALDAVTDFLDSTGYDFAQLGS